MTTDLVATLSGFIADQTGHPAQVLEANRIPGGFSYETWLLRVSWQEGGERREGPMILRKAPLGGVLEPYDASKEFRVLEALEDTSMPAPRARSSRMRAKFGSGVRHSQD